VADIRNQCLRLIVKPLLIPKEREDDHHRCANQMVIKIFFEKTELRQNLDKQIHNLLLVDC
jgi:uncharacterized protein (UPF0332 family)